MSKEFRIGLIALVAGALLYYGFNFLKGTDVFSQTNRYFVKYHHINGLAPGSPVNIQGVQVGRVSSLTFNQKKQNIVVALDIQGDIELGDSTVAELASAGFLGGEIIVLKEKTQNKLLSPSDTLIAEVDAGLAEILEKAGPFTDNLTIVVSDIKEILAGMEGSGEAMLQTIVDLDMMIKQTNRLIAENREGLKRTIDASNATMEVLKERVEQLDPILDNMNALSDSLKNSEFKATIASTNALLQNLNETVDALKNEQGTLGRLMSDDSLYNNLNKTMVDLDKLLIHFNNYPKDFMGPLGRKNKKLRGVDN